MPLPTVNYLLDLSGLNPNNRINSEVHAITPLRRAVAMNYGPFFEQGLTVLNAADDSPLEPVLDYSVALIYPAATMATKKAIYCFIVVNNLSITNIKVSYQVLGGEYTQYTGALQEIIDQLALDDRPIEWGSILGLPSGFSPLPHQHPTYSIHSWGAMIAALDRIKTALLVGNQQAVNEMYAYVNSLLNNVNIPVATIPQAVEGVDNVLRITPYNLKGVLDDRFNALDIPDFEYELDPMDDDWGFFRHKNSGFTVCWGTTTSIASGEAFRAFFRKRFDFRPTIAGSSLNVTSDVTPSGTQWVEITANIVDHTINTESFYVAANRINGTGTDRVRFKYIAIGLSSEDNPLAVSEGSIAIVPPSEGVLEQPLWSGVSGVALKTPATGTYRMGLLFNSSVVGGGYVFNTAAMTPSSNIYYTAYPGLFVDNDYEVSVSITSTTFAPNMTYVGLALNTWHDLAVIRALNPSLPSSGFTFETSGLYGGVVVLAVTIRKKTDHTKIATRSFILDRDSDAPVITTGPQPTPGSASYGYGITAIATTTTSKDFTLDFLADGGSFRIRTFNHYNQNQGNGYIAKMLNFYSDYNIPANWQYLSSADWPSYEVRGLFTPINGFTLAGSSLPVVPAGSALSAGGWHEVSAVLASANGWRLNTVANTSGSASLNLQFRHKTDARKMVTYVLSVNRIGADRIPVWNGNFAVTAAASSGSLVTFEVLFPTNIADGLAVIRWSVNGFYQERQVSYSFGLSSFNDALFMVRYSAYGSGSTLTAGANATNTSWQSLSGSLVFSWQGTVTQNTNLTASFGVAEGSLISVPDAIVGQNFTFDITVS